MRIPLLLLLLLTAITVRSAEDNFDFNPRLQAAYHHVLAFRTQDGVELLITEKKQNPGNQIVPYLEDYIDFLSVFSSDSKSLYEQYNLRKEKRLQKIESVATPSPYKNFCAAEIHLHWAMMGVKYGAYLDAITQLKKAYTLLEDNMRLYPAFEPNKKSMGLIQALLGTIPDRYKWGLKLFGMSGDQEKGFQWLKEVSMSNDQQALIFRDESSVLYALLLMHLRHQGDEAYHYLKSKKFPAEKDLLQVYALSHVSLYSHHNDETIQLLNEAAELPNFYTLPQLEYFRGLAYLNKLDTKAAGYFRSFLSMNKGQNFIKSANQKLAWCALLRGDSIDYQLYISKAENEGNSMTDADKQSLKEAQHGVMPDMDLLKARLLSDGGYYDQAFKMLSTKTESAYITAETKTEYNYRLARI